MLQSALQGLTLTVPDIYLRILGETVILYASRNVIHAKGELEGLALQTIATEAVE